MEQCVKVRIKLVVCVLMVGWMITVLFFTMHLEKVRDKSMQSVCKYEEGRK